MWNEPLKLIGRCSINTKQLTVRAQELIILLFVLSALKKEKKKKTTPFKYRNNVVGIQCCAFIFEINFRISNCMNWSKYTTIPFYR